MKKIYLTSLILILLLLFSANSTFALKIYFPENPLYWSGRAGMYYSSAAGASQSMMYGVGGYYDFSEHWAMRGVVEWTSYPVFGNEISYLPISLDLIYTRHFWDDIYPFIGGGVSYNIITNNNIITNTAGMQFEFGLKFITGSIMTAIEYRYLYSDINNAAGNPRGTSFCGLAIGGFGHNFKL
ncbi:MAG: outer membrane beta-barrel protein [Candidatus Margulisbacteria bacterium]|nr:outer membrane beta-barrel protein [Candidatus Margulisiibacteriota bacterium]MBU1022499.1 outer membrane beta-barrel protein [Candidatus Margulisiibacteriota bacterium]MBU1728483.1 outer membrane beta-barrel protein [Candidatus Margulisiibacteriota bacterium]MBU1954630.1 outer membrane beta-barrel protein [Candidatus Margulisiibacteriota bacterium]